MKEVTVRVETEVELSAVMHIVRDKNGQYFLNAPLDNPELCYAMYGIMGQLLQDSFRRKRSESAIVKASADVLKNLGKNGG